MLTKHLGTECLPLLLATQKRECLFEAANGQSVLIAYWFKHNKQRITEHLSKLGDMCILRGESVIIMSSINSFSHLTY